MNKQHPSGLDDVAPVAVKGAIATIEGALSDLAAHGLDSVVFEGGPMLLGQAHAHVVASEARYRHLISAIGGLVAELSHTGQVLYINPQLASLLGCQPSDWPTLDLFAALQGQPTSQPAIDFKAAVLGQEPLTGLETTVQSALGTVHTVSWHSIPLTHIQKDASRVFLLGLDVTERNRLQTKLQDALVQAEAANLAKSQFLANMSHDIRTPMNAVLGMMELLHTTPLSAQQLGYVNSSESAARALLGLINDILDFSKIEAGKVVLDLQPLLTAQLWHELAVVLAANVGAKPVELVFDIDPAVPAMLLADQRHLVQILINLAGNALKFTARGSVRLRVQVLGNTPASVCLGFSVQDTGIGIPPQQLSHIFSRFTQAEASTTRRFGGTGLGLAIASNLVELMGGRLTVESTLGVGSTFAFELDLPRADPGLAETAQAGPVPSHLRVLLVSGVEETAQLICRDLQTVGWQVAHAGSPELGLRLLGQSHLKQRPFDVLLLDGAAPGASPLAWLQQWHALNHPHPSLPVVLMLGGAGRLQWAGQPAVVQEQARVVVDKPALLPQLVQAVLKAVNQGPDTAAPVPATQSPLLPLKGLHLLLVEDNELNQQVAQGLLTKKGAVVDVADNGEWGVAAVQTAHQQGHPYDLVLMDMQMPVMDGLAATRALRKHPEFKDLPIVAMTANVMDVDREACAQAGMNDHVGKPFDIGVLVRTVLSLTRRGPGPDAPTHGPHPSPAATPAMQQEPTEWLDTPQALARLGGDAALLRRMQIKLAHDLPKMVSDVWATLDQMDLPATKRLLHTIKGTCATVGAVRLSWVAAQAEKQCLQALMPSRADLQAALDGTYAALPTEPTHTPAAPAAAGNAQQALALTAAQTEVLKRLVAALEVSDMSSYDLVEELLKLPHEPAASWDELAQWVDDCAFDEALALCRRLLGG